MTGGEGKSRYAAFLNQGNPFIMRIMVLTSNLPSFYLSQGEANCGALRVNAVD
jgi:hypothetical protein